MPAKTDWTSNDYFNLSDWNRIKNNLIAINNSLKKLHMVSTDLNSLDMTRGTMSIPYVNNVNDLEDNIKKINDALGFSLFENVPYTTWYTRLSAQYTRNPNYTDWNRWESFTLQVQQCIKYMNTYTYQRVSGTFYATTSTTPIQKFSRGR